MQTNRYVRTAGIAHTRTRAPHTEYGITTNMASSTGTLGWLADLHECTRAERMLKRIKKLTFGSSQVAVVRRVLTCFFFFSSDMHCLMYTA